MDPDIATTAGAEEAQALARAFPGVHEVHTDPDQPQPCEKNLPPAPCPARIEREQKPCPLGP